MSRLCVFGFFIVVAVGCSSSSGDTPMTAVKGTINLDGKALSEGEVTFAMGNTFSELMAVKDGTFSGKAAVGKNQVSVRAYKAGPPLSTDPMKAPTKINIIPDRFNIKTELQAEVTSGGANDFKFDVKSR